MDRISGSQISLPSHPQKKIPKIICVIKLIFVKIRSFLNLSKSPKMHNLAATIIKQNVNKNVDFQKNLMQFCGFLQIF